MKTLRGARRFLCALLLMLQPLLGGAAGLFAQSFSLTRFDLELRGLEGEAGSLGIAGTLKAGGAVSFGRHFNLFASAELASGNVISLFNIDEDTRAGATLKVTSVAMEFPFSDGWALTPVVFLGEYVDVASDDLLARTLKTSMSESEFLRYGALSVFSNETNTQGLGGGLIWRAEKHPLALAAYGSWDGKVMVSGITESSAISWLWDGNIESSGFNVYAQFAGIWRALSWNMFAILGRGEEDSAAWLSYDDFYMSAGLTALVGNEDNFSFYVQASVLPFKLGSSSYFKENIASRLHFLFEPRYTARAFSAAAAFFVSPVMQEKNVPFLGLEEGVLYAGGNISVEGGGVAWGDKSIGLNFALFADTSGANSGGWQDILRICASPFFKVKGDVFILTVSAFFNFSKILTPLSAGEINLHIEAAL